jgi:hypothetical protein
MNYYVVIMLSVIKLSVIMLSVVMLSVLAPLEVLSTPEVPKCSVAYVIHIFTVVIDELAK